MSVSKPSLAVQIHDLLEQSNADRITVLAALATVTGVVLGLEQDPTVRHAQLEKVGEILKSGSGDMARSLAH